MPPQKRGICMPRPKWQPADELAAGPQQNNTTKRAAVCITVQSDLSSTAITGLLCVSFPLQMEPP